MSLTPPQTADVPLARPRGRVRVERREQGVTARWRPRRGTRVTVSLFEASGRHRVDHARRTTVTNSDARVAVDTSVTVDDLPRPAVAELHDHGVTLPEVSL